MCNSSTHDIYNSSSLMNAIYNVESQITAAEPAQYRYVLDYIRLEFPVPPRYRGTSYGFAINTRRPYNTVLNRKVQETILREKCAFRIFSRVFSNDIFSQLFYVLQLLDFCL